MGLLSSLSVEFFSYYKAILARAIFGTHALVAVWRTTVVMGVVYWTLAMGVVLLCVEYVITMWVRMGKEWPWVSPSTFCYLSTTASALWIQKLESLGHVQSLNGSFISALPGLNLELDFSAADWLLLTEQTMMVTIILSRWLLPKGEMSNKDLSSLLLLYLGLSADILDFSTIFNEPQVARDQVICYVILVIWTGSLAQFILVLTNTAKVEKEAEKIDMKSLVCSSEIWQILVQVGLQDLPFLLIRVLALMQYQVFNYTIIFFVCKNTLVIALELYHLVALCMEQRRKLKRKRERMRQLKAKMQGFKSTVTTMNKWKKNPFELPKKDEKKMEPAEAESETTKSVRGQEYTDGGSTLDDSGISATSTPDTTKKSSLMMAAFRMKDSKAKDGVQAKDKPNEATIEASAEVDAKDGTDYAVEQHPKSGSRLAIANNRLQNNSKAAISSNVLFAEKISQGGLVNCGTPPISHIKPSRVHNQLPASFDSRSTLGTPRKVSVSSSSRTGSSSSTSGLTDTTNASSVFDVDESVF